jgi:RNase P/RNase MRP subunit POP5
LAGVINHSIGTIIAAAADSWLVRRLSLTRAVFAARRGGLRRLRASLAAPRSLKFYAV